MTVQIFNEKFDQIDPYADYCGTSADVYSSHIVPSVTYLNTKRDVKVLWYENLSECFSKNKDSWNPEITVEEINHSEIDLVIFPVCNHPFLLTQNQVNYIHRLSKPHLILSWNKDGLFLEDGIINDLNWMFFPYWAMVYPADLGVAVPSLNDALNSTRGYLFSCLNGHPTYNRLLNLAWVTKHTHTFTKENSIITCALTDRVTGQSIDIQPILARLDNIWPEGSDIICNRLMPQMPLLHDKVEPFVAGEAITYRNALSCTGDAFVNTYINIVAETDCNNAFISEKSLKPILAGQLFVTTASPGTIDTLRVLGFDVFDDILEHRTYSEYSNSLIRVKALHKYLEKLTHLDWEKIYNETLSRRLHNRQLLLSGEISICYFQKLQQKINECI